MEPGNHWQFYCKAVAEAGHRRQARHAMPDQGWRGDETGPQAPVRAFGGLTKTSLNPARAGFVKYFRQKKGPPVEN
jgi:hypothetical protein